MAFSKTQLFDRLQELEIEFSKYEHPPVLTVEAQAKYVSSSDGALSKNLFLKDKYDRYYIVSALVDTRVDLKVLSQTLGLGRGGIRMAPEKALGQLLQVPLGCVSPFAVVYESARDVSLLLDKNFKNQTRCIFHPLSNDVSISLNTSGLDKFLESIGRDPVYVDLEAKDQPPSGSVGVLEPPSETSFSPIDVSAPPDASTHDMSRRSLLSKKMGPALSRFGCCCYKPAVSNDDAEVNNIQEEGPRSRVEYERPPLRSRAVNDEIQEVNVVQEPVDQPKAISEAVDELSKVIVNLSEVISQSCAKDPLESVKRKRDDLMKFVLVVAGMTTLASLVNAPGGLDSDGSIRFKYTLLFWFYCVSVEASFVVSYLNVLMLQSPLSGDIEKDKKVLSKRLTVGLWLLVGASLFYIVSYVTGFWLVYPGDEPHKLITFSKNSWPRWWTVGVGTFKACSIAAFAFKHYYML